MFNIKRKIFEIHPCTEDGKVTLEGYFVHENSELSLFSKDEIGKIVPFLSGLNNIRYSREIGYLLAEHSTGRVHVFHQGKIIIRRVENENSAMKIFRYIIRTLWPTIICPSCANPLLYSLRTNCPVCSSNFPPITPSSILNGEFKRYGYSSEKINLSLTTISELLAHDYSTRKTEFQLFFKNLINELPDCHEEAAISILIILSLLYVIEECDNPENENGVRKYIENIRQLDSMPLQIGSLEWTKMFNLNIKNLVRRV
mgnify:CR=1 FL=1